MTSLFKRTNKTRIKNTVFSCLLNVPTASCRLLHSMWCRMVLTYLLGKPRVVGSIPGRDTHSLWSCARDGIQGKTLANQTLAVATPSGKGEARSIFSWRLWVLKEFVFRINTLAKAVIKHNDNTSLYIKLYYGQSLHKGSKVIILQKNVHYQCYMDEYCCWMSSF